MIPGNAIRTSMRVFEKPVSALGHFLPRKLYGINRHYYHCLNICGCTCQYVCAVAAFQGQSKTCLSSADGGLYSLHDHRDYLGVQRTIPDIRVVVQRCKCMGFVHGL